MAELTPLVSASTPVRRAPLQSTLDYLHHSFMLQSTATEGTGMDNNPNPKTHLVNHKVKWKTGPLQLPLVLKKQSNTGQLVLAV